MEELAVLELEFYKSSSQHLQAIEDRLQEIEEDYLRTSHTYYDEELGLLSIKARSVEDAVIWKIEAEEALGKAKERILKRCARTERALSRLDDEEQRVLLNSSSVKDQRKLRHALLKFYRGILHQKKEKRDEKMRDYKQRIAENLKQYLEGGKDG